MQIIISSRCYLVGVCVLTFLYVLWYLVLVSLIADLAIDLEYIYISPSLECFVFSSYAMNFQDNMSSFWGAGGLNTKQFHFMVVV